MGVHRGFMGFWGGKKGLDEMRCQTLPRAHDGRRCAFPSGPMSPSAFSLAFLAASTATLPTTVRDRIPSRPVASQALQGAVHSCMYNSQSDSCFMSWLVTSPAAL